MRVTLSAAAVLVAWANTRWLLARLRGAAGRSPVPLVSLLLAAAAAALWPRPPSRFLVFAVPALLDLPLHALLLVSWARGRSVLPQRDGRDRSLPP
jgi:hypothetical protein